MNIWTFKTGLIPALATVLALGACSETGGAFGEGGSFLTSRGGGLFAPQNNALTSVGLMGGALFLQPPSGYCIDRRSYRTNFALIARCDTLGASTGPQAEPLGLMTVSVVPASEQPDAAELAQMAVPPQARVLERYASGDVRMAYVSGGGPELPGAAKEHWRAVVTVEDFVVGFAAYQPAERPASQATGRANLVTLIRQSRAATAAAPVPGSVVTKNSTRGVSYGLFD